MLESLWIDVERSDDRTGSIATFVVTNKITKQVIGLSCNKNIYKSLPSDKDVRQVAKNIFNKGKMRISDEFTRAWKWYRITS